MPDTTARALTLLDLLQSHRHWPAAELAQRLGVTVRTVRRDIERLRSFGYRIDSVPGVFGGYRLEAGNALPPLLLSDEEAVTMAVGLRIIATGRLTRGAESALSALAKLEQMLPAPLRRRVSALAHTIRPAGRRDSEVSLSVLTELAMACRDHERVRFTYRSAQDDSCRRHVEPHALVPAGQNWYLVCWDLDRVDWRTFRVDRLSDVEHTGAPFAPRPLSPQQIEELVDVARSWAPQPVQAEAIIDMPLEAFRARFGEWAQGATADGPARTRWPVGGATAQDIIYGLSWIPADLTYTTQISEPTRTELRDILRGMRDAFEER